MSFVTINCKIDQAFEKELLLNKNKLDFCFFDNKASFYYDFQDWNKEPFAENDTGRLYLSGWFINDNYERNNLDWLLNSLAKTEDVFSVINKIEAGVFVAIYIKQDSFYVFTDPFALSPHYYCIKDSKLFISPSPKSLSSENNVDNVMKDILQKQGHLFGSHTIYPGVKRFIPGDIIFNDGKQFENIISNGFAIAGEKYPADEILSLAKRLISSTKESLLSIAISAGFDSRLILEVSKPSYSYTWGPETSLDVINGVLLSSNQKIKHEHFRFKSNIVSSDVKHICNYLFCGSVSSYNPQFMQNYKFVSKNSVHNSIALDGYLGDVLQRGVYMSFSSWKGEILKLFPFLNRYFLDEYALLRSRYKKLSDTEFDYVLIDFNEKVSKIHGIDPLQRVTYYEFLYGRGLRYITSGALVMNSVYKTVFPVFASRKIFSSLVRENADDVICYRVFHKIWSNCNSLAKKIRSEGLYSPKTKPFFIPYLNFAGRLLTNFHPKFSNYTKE